MECLKTFSVIRSIIAPSSAEILASAAEILAFMYSSILRSESDLIVFAYSLASEMMLWQILSISVCLVNASEILASDSMRPTFASCNCFVMFFWYEEIIAPMVLLRNL